mmetsp:Transcript_42073/g.116211  ORF Transcript_42073/g.116211 Transcript_42073/m.116211 type:complete len:223 (-) Transcript_42073:127-795(-)
MCLRAACCRANSSDRLSTRSCKVFVSETCLWKSSDMSFKSQRRDGSSPARSKSWASASPRSCASSLRHRHRSASCRAAPRSASRVLARLRNLAASAFSSTLRFAALSRAAATSPQAASRSCSKARSRWLSSRGPSMVESVLGVHLEPPNSLTPWLRGVASRLGECVGELTLDFGALRLSTTQSGTRTRLRCGCLRISSLRSPGVGADIEMPGLQSCGSMMRA